MNATQAQFDAIKSLHPMAQAAKQVLDAARAKSEAEFAIKMTHARQHGGIVEIDMIGVDSHREERKVWEEYANLRNSYQSAVTSAYKQALYQLERLSSERKLKAGWADAANAINHQANLLSPALFAGQLTHAEIVAKFQAFTEAAEAIGVTFKEAEDTTALRNKKAALVKTLNDAVRHHKQAQVRLHKDPESKAAQKKLADAKATYDAAKKEYDAL